MAAESRSWRRGLFRIHAWIGLQFGFLLFAVCFTGTLAVLSAELTWLADPQLRAGGQAPADSAPLSWQRLHDVVAAAHPQAAILYLHAPEGPRSVARAVIAYGPQDYRWVPVDVTQGYAVRDHRSSFGLQSFLRILHKQFYLVPAVIGIHGTLIVGALGLPLLLAVFTGLVSVKRWWRAMRQVRRGRSARLFWSDLHRFAGLWAALVTLLLALTGLWYFAETILERSGLLHEDGPRVRLSAAVMEQRPALLPPSDLNRAALVAQAAWPGLRLTQLALPVRGDDALVFTGPAEAWLVRDRANKILIDPFAYTVLQAQHGEDLPAGQRWIETADPLHFGSFAGLGSKLV
ncbi:MAG: PepSY-associated TM helix domain-containing protein [Ferrovibrio sp.]|uniref:PepSY-associated TM helix domain-containing protein n=1 Tax=Ferrovibrio sp. TaxID=1917215 RepID=UPI00391CB05C